MKIKKNSFISVLLSLAIAVVMTACSGSTSKSYTFNVETGDSIKVTLDTSNGLDLNQSDGQFTVTDKDGSNIISGMFITADQFDQQKSAVEAESAAEITEESSTSIAWEYTGDSGDEHDRMQMVTDNTGVLMGSLADKDAADAAYEALTLESGS